MLFDFWVALECLDDTFLFLDFRIFLLDDLVYLDDKLGDFTGRLHHFTYFLLFRFLLRYSHAFVIQIGATLSISIIRLVTRSTMDHCPIVVVVTVTVTITVVKIEELALGTDIFGNSFDIFIVDVHSGTSNRNWLYKSRNWMIISETVRILREKSTSTRHFDTTTLGIEV